MEALGYYSDQARSDVRIDTAIAAAEYEQRAVNFHHAAQRYSSATMRHTSTARISNSLSGQRSPTSP